jgi:hypothetical protein
MPQTWVETGPPAPPAMSPTPSKETSTASDCRRVTRSIPATREKSATNTGSVPNRRATVDAVVSLEA